MNLISCQSLSYRFEKKNLFSNLSFKIEPGQFWAITGPSGAGKSTLLKLLTGEISIQSGSIEKSGSIAEVPQSLSLSGGLTAHENIATGDLKNYSWIKTFFSIPKQSLLKAQKVSESFYISDTLHQSVESLSGGEKQRIALARAWMQESDLLLADEPVSMLDHKLADQILTVLKDKSIICVLHQQDLVEKYATHIIDIDSRHPQGWSVTVRKSL